MAYIRKLRLIFLKVGYKSGIHCILVKKLFDAGEPQVSGISPGRIWKEDSKQVKVVREDTGGGGGTGGADIRVCSVNSGDVVLY